ncbi:MAG: LysR family transcriptional regulator [Bauldia sp.]|nr:LysR family transcriptional regulator [Bauldia sp.]
MDHLTGLRAFTRVVEAGSFTAAAEFLSLSQSQVSKAIAAIEERLSVRLLNRTTRKITPTEAGEDYYRRCRKILLDLEEADASAKRAQNSPAGILRIDASAMVAQFLLLPSIFAFQEKYPALEVHLTVNDRRIDLIESGVDVAVRVGTLEDSSLVVRWAGSAASLMVASPEYIARMGEPLTKEDLKRHNFLVRPGSGARTYSRGAVAAELGLQGPVRLGNKVLVREAALAGRGIGFLPEFMVDKDIARGALQPLLGNVRWPRMELGLLHPYSRGAPAKVRAFIEFILKEWRDTGRVTVPEAEAPGRRRKAGVKGNGKAAPGDIAPDLGELTY